MEAAVIPGPGETAGWVVYYGLKREHQVWCHQDYEHALQVAVRLRGVVVRLVAAPEAPAS